MLTADALEGEILQRRFAVLQVLSQHGDWVRCRVHDMESHQRCEAMVQLGGTGEPEVELLPEDQTPPPVDLPQPAAPAVAAPPPPPPPPPPVPAEAPPDPDPAPSDPDPAPSSERSQKPGRLEAAWFATGAKAGEQVDEEAREEEDGDILIAPSKVEQIAVDLTTGTYRRYALDGTPAHPVAVIAENSTPAMTPVATPGPDVPAAPVASGNRRTLLIVALVLLGVGLATLLFALLY
jgi:hypothetical protein